MIEREDGRLRVTVPMVMANARGLLEAGRSALGQGGEVIDLGAVAEADSSALAVMLGWLRTAEARGSSIVFANLPVGVRSLADLYGVAELLSVA
ncbi:MAG: binding protein (contains domain) [Rhodocyclaceae bacterium]|nr:binding protein (contains domain) [Rhodocyclaceae bacterium]